MKKPIKNEPIMIEAFDQRLKIYGNVMPVRCRVISEDNYATLYNKALLWENYGVMPDLDDRRFKIIECHR